MTPPLLTSLERKLITCLNIKTSYLEGGQGPTLILIHGGNAAGALSFYPVLDLLKNDFHVIAPDLPGCGESGAASSAEEVLAWFEEFRKHFSDGKNTTIVASSIGGAMCLHSFKKTNSMQERLVLVNSAGLEPFKPPFLFALTMLLFVLFPSLLTLFWMSKLSRARIWDDEKIRSMVAYLLSRMKSKGGRDFFKIYNDFSKPVTIQPGLKIQLLWGQEDPIILVPKLQLPVTLIENASHYPFMDQPELFCKKLKETLDLK